MVIPAVHGKWIIAWCEEQLGNEACPSRQLLRVTPARASAAASKEGRSQNRGTFGGEGGADSQVAGLTLGGCFVEMMFTLDIGTKLNIGLWINDVKVSAEGTVVTRLRQAW